MSTPGLFGDTDGLFMSRATPSSWAIQKQFRAAVYQGVRGWWGQETRTTL